MGTCVSGSTPMAVPNEHVDTVSSEKVADYSGFDFASLWSGRAQVTAAERAVIREALGSRSHRRVLEIGVGFGRLTDAVRDSAQEYVGLDFDPMALQKLPPGTPAGPGFRRGELLVEANAYHLPFVPSAFSGAVAVRIYHHLNEPLRVLGEVHRCLAGGGKFVLQYNPKPSVATLQLDLDRRIRRSYPPARSITFSGSEDAILDAGPGPVLIPTRRSVLHALARSGFRAEREWALPPETLARCLALGSKGKVASRFGQSFLFPSRFVSAIVEKPPNGRSPELSEILACPRCRTPFGRLDRTSSWERACERCTFRITSDGRVVHARYLPPGASVHRLGSAHPHSASTHTDREGS
jgi:SAM-dependent methyltransferase